MPLYIKSYTRTGAAHKTRQKYLCAAGISKPQRYWNGFDWERDSCIYILKLSLLQLLFLENEGYYILFNYEVAKLPHLILFIIVMLYCQCSVQDQEAEEC